MSTDYTATGMCFESPNLQGGRSKKNKRRSWEIKVQEAGQQVIGSRRFDPPCPFPSPQEVLWEYSTVSCLGTC